MAISVVEANQAGAVLQRCHDVGIDDARLALQQTAHPDLTIGVHACRQAVAAVFGVLQRDRIGRPLQDEEAQREDVDPGIVDHEAPIVSVGTSATHAVMQQQACARGLLARRMRGNLPVSQESG